MTGHPNDSRGDVAYWGLTPMQAAMYHSRLARMHADNAQRFADLCTHYARQGERVTIFGFGAVLVLAVFAVIGAWVA